MLASKRGREIIGLLLHNDKSLHLGTRTHVTSILFCFLFSEGTAPACRHPRCAQNTVERGFWGSLLNILISGYHTAVHDTSVLFHKMCCERDVLLRRGTLWSFVPFISNVLYSVLLHTFDYSFCLYASLRDSLGILQHISFLFIISKGVNLSQWTFFIALSNVSFPLVPT